MEIFKSIDIKIKKCIEITKFLKTTRQTGRSFHVTFVYNKNKLINIGINNLKKLIEDNINLYNLSEKNVTFHLEYKSEKVFIEFDLDQISRVLVNIIKNSLESIHEKQEVDKNFQGLINIEVKDDNEFINIIIDDNGVGFKSTPKDLVAPLTTTKKYGSGLGLSIASKILFEHGGDLKFLEKNDGAKIILSIKSNQ